jgi:hypothetical protein
MEKAIKYMPSSSSFTTYLSLKPPIAINHNTTGDRATSGAAAGAHHIGVEGPPKWHKARRLQITCKPLINLRTRRTDVMGPWSRNTLATTA